MQRVRGEKRFKVKVSASVEIYKIKKIMRHIINTENSKGEIALKVLH